MKLYILHGWTQADQPMQAWHPFCEQLKSYGHTVEFLTLPGFGDEVLAYPWGVDEYVSWVTAKLEEKDPVVLIGHSFGGQIAAHIAAKYPQYISRLVLLDSSGFRNAKIRSKLKRVVFLCIAKFGKIFVNFEVLRKLLYKVIGEGDYLKASPVMRITMKRVISDDVRVQLRKIDVQTLLIWGGEDKVTPLSIAKVFRSSIKNASLKIIKGARHSPQFTHYKEAAEYINHFLSQSSREHT